MSDSPPADWYTDPEDHEQYRYWDGSAWTGHRAPRHTDQDPPPQESALRGPWRLIADSFSLSLRQWKSLSVAALLTAAGFVLLLLLGLLTLDALLGGDLSEVWRRIADPDIDLDTPEQEAYLESLELDWSPLTFLPLAIGLLLAWASWSTTHAMAVRVTLNDLRNRPVSVVESLTLSLRRVPRVMGLFLQLLVLAAVTEALSWTAGRADPGLQILLDLIWLAAQILLAAVLALAYVVAAAGPSQFSLLYAVRLVKGRFWKALGRELLLLLVYVAAIMAMGLVLMVGLVLAVVLESLLMLLLPLLVMAVFIAALSMVEIVFSTILYDDLGGESD